MCCILRCLPAPQADLRLGAAPTPKSLGTGTGGPHKQCVCLCWKYKEMYGRILNSLNIVNLYRGMSKLKLKIKGKIPQLLCIVFSVALNGEFERFGEFCVDCYYAEVFFLLF